MKKYNRLAVALAITTAFSGSVYANEKSVNEELSDVRTQISKQMLENKLYQAQLDGLQKRQEIQKIQNSLDGVSSGSSNSRSVEIKQEHSFEFSESIHDEDILSQDNNWEQNVGFVYQDDIVVGGGISNQSITSNDAISGLTEDDDLDFAEMLDKVASQANEDIESSDGTSNAESLSSLNEFKLISVELQKLDIYDSEKRASVKVNYITNNGYQKIKGSKIINVSEGSNFNVKGKNSFEVVSISDGGVKFKNLTTGEEGFATR